MKRLGLVRTIFELVLISVIIILLVWNPFRPVTSRISRYENVGTFPSRWKDVQATPLIIESLSKAGYRFLTLPELLAKGRVTH